MRGKVNEGLKNAFTIVAVLLVVIFLLNYRSFICPGKNTDFTEDSTVVKLDSSLVEMKPGKELEIQIDTVYQDSIVYLTQPIDSEAVAKAYFEHRTFSYSTRDENLSLDLEIDLFKNTVTEIRPSYKLLRPHTTQYFSAKPKHLIFLGLEAGQQFTGPRVEWIIKEKWSIGASYNLYQGPSKFNFSLSYLIFKK